MGPSKIDDDSYMSEMAIRIKEQQMLDKFLGGSGCCLICGNFDPEQLEEHHIAGRKHSDITITLCANHHLKMSRRQRSLPADWLKKDIPLHKRAAFMLLGLAELLSMAGKELLDQQEGA